jgi:hypothetical protein
VPPILVNIELLGVEFFFGLRSLPGHSLSGDSGKNPALIAACSFAVLIQGLTALASLAGAFDAGGIFGGDSDDCCRLKGSLAGVRGLPGVLFTRV